MRWRGSPGLPRLWSRLRFEGDCVSCAIKSGSAQKFRPDDLDQRSRTVKGAGNRCTGQVVGIRGHKEPFDLFALGSDSSEFG
jgi:hypothetical protein